MAFFNRVGSILKQSVSKHSNLELSPSNASLFQAIRSMSSSKLFVGGLSYGTDESSLKEAFSQYGDVIEGTRARVIMDRDTGRSRGFGFISFPSSEEAASALQAMDGQDLHGRRIRVNYATEKPRTGFGGGYGGGGGGFNYGSEGGNFAGGGGYAASNYGSGGGGYGNSTGFNYGGEGGNSAGAGGYPTSNYGGGFSGGNSSAGGYGSYGGGTNYGNDNSSPVEGGNYGGGVGYGSGNYGNTPNSNYSSQGNNFSGGYDGGNSGNGFGESPGASFNGGQEQVSVDQGTQPINEDIGQETSEGNYDEPKDFANTRG
ncbi:PREDICTED: glycine-rich RNA-binding protein 7-like isoform X1 [Nicotiana attenuata]|uniref:glycine-rich RNA-binding protein 7-like isoform X1 n=1 Tax=Nicotiana attenuata TaxID=49451 RepID=UPI00090583F1|nr:PREDICTED: glycine-rich RNA-binding protein 7-like isoform X1 [Nicotiana attenuata]